MKYSRLLLLGLTVVVAGGLLVGALAFLSNFSQVALAADPTEEPSDDFKTNPPSPDEGSARERVRPSRDGSGTNETESPYWAGSEYTPAPSQSGKSPDSPLALGDIVYTFTVSALGSTPVGLVHDGNGNLYMTEITLDDIILMDTSGVEISRFSMVTNTLNGLHLATDGSIIYVSDTTDDDIDSYSTAGTYINSFSVASKTTFPEGITYNPISNTLLVVNGSGLQEVYEYNLTGTPVSTYTINGSSPDGLAFDPLRCSYWLYDSGTDSVRHYDVNFNELEAFPGTASAGYGFGEGLAVISDTLYVMATGTATAVAFDISEAISATFPGCPYGTLSGQVVSANNAAPIDGAQVVADSGSAAFTTTSSTGEYIFNLLPVGTYEVAVDKAFYQPETLPGIVVANQGTTLQDFQLRRGWFETGTSHIETAVRLGLAYNNPLTISNTGTAALDFLLLDTRADLNFAGPDNFGYTAIGLNESVCTFDYIPITTTGTLVATGDDTSSVNSGIFSPVGLGEPFDLYGQIFNELVMATNGYLTTDPLDGGPDLSNDCPVPATPSTPAGTNGARLYPLHDDLVSDGYYEYFSVCPRPSDDGVVQGCSVFEWSSMHWPSSAGWTQEAILYHTTGEIVYQIGPGNPELGGGSTTGLQDFAPPTTGVNYTCNTFGSIPDNTAVCVSGRANSLVDALWASETLAASSILHGDGQALDVVFDTATITQTGTYTGHLHARGDFENMPAPVTLVMHVTQEGVVLSGDQFGSGIKGTQVDYDFQVTNNGLFADSFDLALSGNSWPSGLSSSSTGSLDPGESTTVTLAVVIPANAPEGSMDSVVLTATSTSEPLMNRSSTATTEALDWKLSYIPIILDALVP